MSDVLLLTVLHDDGDSRQRYRVLRSGSADDDPEGVFRCDFLIEIFHDTPRIKLYILNRPRQVARERPFHGLLLCYHSFS